jgi:hypothetical protein
MKLSDNLQMDCKLSLEFSIYAILTKFSTFSDSVMSSIFGFIKTTFIVYEQTHE